MMARSSPRVRPLSTVPICESDGVISAMFRRTITWGRPLVRGKRLHVLLRRLRVALVTERQGAVQEDVARLRAHLDELRAGELLQGGARVSMRPMSRRMMPALTWLTCARATLAGAMIADFGFSRLS